MSPTGRARVKTFSRRVQAYKMGHVRAVLMHLHGYDFYAPVLALFVRVTAASKCLPCGLRDAEKFAPELLKAGIGLPGEDGLQACRAIACQFNVG